MAKKKPAKRKQTGATKTPGDVKAGRVFVRLTDENGDAGQMLGQADDSKGRPAGSENRQYDYVDASVTRCRKCGSTERTRYEQTRELSQDGTTPDGLPFTHVVWRRTCCKACGQWRIDRFYENRKGGDHAAVA